MSSIAANGNSALSGTAHIHRYVSLTTYPKDGDPIASTVWFAARRGKLFIRTSVDSYITKNIRQDAHVLVTPSGRSGEPYGVAVVGMARIVPQLETAEPQRWIDHKYGLLAGVLPFLGDTRSLGNDLIIEITLDPGPGTNDLLVEHISEEQQCAARQRTILYSAFAVSLTVAGLATLAAFRRRH